MPAERPYGVDQETRLANRENILQGLTTLWEKAAASTGKRGLLAAVPVELATKVGQQPATLSLAVDLTATERTYGEPFDIISRLSLSTTETEGWKEIPKDPRVLRPGEIAARQLTLAPMDEYNKATGYVTTDEQWQQHGLAKALVAATDDFAGFLTKYFQSDLPTQETYVSITDVSAGKGELELQDWTSRVARDLAGFRHVGDIGFQKKV